MSRRRRRSEVQANSPYHFRPCRDADVLIRNDELIINGSSYGLLKQADAVTVDHGKVLINETVVPAVARR